MELSGRSLEGPSVEFPVYEKRTTTDVLWTEPSVDLTRRLSELYHNLLRGHTLLVLI